MAGVKKNAARRRATLVFLDESGFSERPAVRRTWAPRGQTPVLTHRFRSWNNLSVIGALAYRVGSPQRSRVFLRMHTGAVRSPQIIRFLQHLRRHIRGPILLLWDGLHAHRSLATQAYLRTHSWLTVHRLPAYAPDLNPVEGAWQHLKHVEMRNLVCLDLEELHLELYLAVGRLRQKPRLIRSFFVEAGLEAQNFTFLRNA